MKKINDPIHGTINFPEYVTQIVDTEEFQRLRNLKQLGIGSKVFHGATHTRFEHCLGVCHVAETLLDILERNSAVTIDAIHRKCVIIAGLLHDVGHGPFSHMWENFVHLGTEKNWSHEQSSCDITKIIFTKYGIKLSPEPLEHLYGIEIITALIVCDMEKLELLLKPDLMFLTEIINNKFCVIDVDKWDYILRDSYYLNNNIQIDDNFTNFYKNAKISKDSNGVSHISYNINDFDLIYELFENRSRLHIECYQHPTILGLERMLIDLFQSAEEDGFTIKNTKLSEAHLNNDVYMFLDDTILNIIDVSDETMLNRSKELSKRLKQRKLYANIFTSGVSCNLEILNSIHGDVFYEIHKKIPLASEIMPKNLILHNDNGEIVAKEQINDGQYHEKYLVYSKTNSVEINEEASNYLKQTLTSSAT